MNTLLQGHVIRPVSNKAINDVSVMHINNQN